MEIGANKKWEFTGETKVVTDEYEKPHTVKRIRRLSDGKVGGWIDTEDTLSQYGNCWIDDEAVVFNHSFVDGDAVVSGHAKVSNCIIRDKAQVHGKARLYGSELYGPSVVKSNAIVRGEASIDDGSLIDGNAVITGKATVWGSRVDQNARVDGEASVGRCSTVTGSAIVDGNSNVLSARIAGNAMVYGHAVVDAAWVLDNAKIHGKAKITDATKVYDDAEVFGDVTIKDSEVYGVAKVDGSKWSELSNGRLAGNFWDHPQVRRDDAEEIIEEAPSILDDVIEDMRFKTLAETGVLPDRPTKEELNAIFPPENESFMIDRSKDVPFLDLQDDSDDLENNGLD